MEIDDIEEIMGTPLVKQIDFKKSGLTQAIKKALFASLNER